jgi:hypothetical protein
MRGGAVGEEAKTYCLHYSDERWGRQNEFLPSSPLVLFANILGVPEGEVCALPGIKAVGIVSA